MLLPLALLLAAQAPGTPQQAPTIPQGRACAVGVLRTPPVPIRRPSRPPGGWQQMSVTIGNQVLMPLAVDAGFMPHPGVQGIYNLSLFVPATGDTEYFILGVPGGSAAQDVPLLVGFHAYGFTHADVLLHTNFFTEAFARGWYVLAPLAFASAGDPTVNYGARETIRNADAAFRWVVSNFNIDRERLYGVGFSMGGATLGSFAAHHLDPKQGMFAAMVQHTGSVDQADTYREEILVRPAMQALFGGAPGLWPFEYRRSSILELDKLTRLPVTGGVHLLETLSYAPLQVWYADQDPLAYLLYQDDYLVQLTLAAGGLVDQQVVAGTFHQWQPTLDETFACNWLAQHQLVLPTSGVVWLDEDRVAFDYDVQLETAGEFARFDFEVNLAFNRLQVTSSTNLAHVTANVDELGLDKLATVQLLLYALDNADTVAMSGFPVAPSAVLRDGNSQVGIWTYDPLTGTVEIVETNPLPHLWEIVP